MKKQSWSSVRNFRMLLCPCKTLEGRKENPLLSWFSSYCLGVLLFCCCFLYFPLGQVVQGCFAWGLHPPFLACCKGFNLDIDSDIRRIALGLKHSKPELYVGTWPNSQYQNFADKNVWMLGQLTLFPIDGLILWQLKWQTWQVLLKYLRFVLVENSED